MKYTQQLSFPEGGEKFEREGDGGGEAPPPDIASGGYELRAAFELWGLDAAALVAGAERPIGWISPERRCLIGPGRTGRGEAGRVATRAGVRQGRVCGKGLEETEKSVYLRVKRLTKDKLLNFVKTSPLTS
jgi:hypothetical protein